MFRVFASPSAACAKEQARDKSCPPKRNRAFERNRRTLCKFASLLTLTVPLLGCSISTPIASLVADDEITTGSIRSKKAPLSDKLSPEDWRRAKSALGVALEPAGNGTPVRWDNPESKASGHFAAAGGFIIRNDLICRPFQSALIIKGSESAPNGVACRQGPGEWNIASEAVPPGQTTNLQPGGLF